MYAKNFELYKLKRIISEKYGRTRRIGPTAFHVTSKKKFIISMDAKARTEKTVKVYMYPFEYKIRIYGNSTVRDVLEKLLYREFLTLKSHPKKTGNKRSPLGITGINSTGQKSKKRKNQG